MSTKSRFSEVVGALILMLVILVYALILGRLERLKSRWLNSFPVMVLALSVPLLVWANFFNWADCGAALPLFTLSTCVLLGWNYKKLPPGQARL